MTNPAIDKAPRVLALHWKIVIGLAWGVLEGGDGADGAG